MGIGNSITDARMNRMGFIRGSIDFSVDGAVGAHYLKDAHGNVCSVPKGAVVKTVVIKPSVVLASGGLATVALGLLASNDVLAATAFDAAPFNATDFAAGIQTGAAANCLAITDDSKLAATVAVAAVTSGVVEVLVEFFMPQ